MDPEVRFGPFVFDPKTGGLRKHGLLLKVVGQPLEVLAILLEQPGKVVTRDELRRRLWSTDTFVDFEHGLNAAVNKLRSVLGDSAAQPRYIRTVPRRGYVFVGTIAAPGPAVVEAGPPTSTPHGPPPPQARGRTAALALSVVLVAFVAWLGWPSPGAPARPLPDRMTIVVLPFENLSGSPDDDYFAEGLTDETITILGQLDPVRLGVIARRSAAAYRGQAQRVQQIADDLGVDFVVDGTVRVVGERIRVSAQLIRAGDDVQVWAESYDRHARDLLSVQEDLARAIAARIELTLPAVSGRSHRHARRPAPDAYEAYLRGRFLLGRRTVEAVSRGHAHLQSAVHLDPTFALGHAGLAEAFVLMASYRALAPAEAVPQAIAAARRALELDPELAEGHAALAVINCNYQWQWAEAERGFTRALALNPSSVDTRLKYAECLSYLGRLDEAVREADAALRLDPVSLIANAQAAIIHYRARRFDEALDRLRRLQELDPHYPLTFLNRGLVLLALERPQDAVHAFERGRELDPASADLAGLLGFAMGRAGRPAEARVLLEELEQRATREFVQPYTLGLVHLGLGEREAAVAWLERAYAERSWLASLVNVAPELDALREHPRFHKLVARMGFPR